MKIIKNSKELAGLVDGNKDLIFPDDDLRIEFEPTKDEIRNVECINLFLMNDDQKFDFNGWNFNGGNFNGGNFNGWDFNGMDFNGMDFNGKDFNGKDFNGWDFNGMDFNGMDFNGEDFNGGNFNGKDFNGMDFNGEDFNGRDFNGKDFNGMDFNGEDFNGRKVSYYAFFNCYGSIKCMSIAGRRSPCNEPVSLENKIEITGEEDMVEIKVEGKTKRISRTSAKELNLID